MLKLLHPHHCGASVPLRTIIIIWTEWHIHTIWGGSTFFLVYLPQWCMKIFQYLIIFDNLSKNKTKKPPKKQKTQKTKIKAKKFSLPKVKHTPILNNNDLNLYMYLHDHNLMLPTSLTRLKYSDLMTLKKKII